MAIKATIYKATLQVADMDRNVYGDHSLTLPLQPSETEERLIKVDIEEADIVYSLAQRYEKEKNLDKAGCYAAQEKKDPVVKKVVGSYTNVVGLPMELVKKLLKSSG